MNWKPALCAATVVMTVAACAPAPSPTGEQPSTPPASEQPQTQSPEARQPATVHTPGTSTTTNLTVTRDGQPVAFAPTNVYCKGKPGSLRHLIAKTNNQPPLLEVTPGQFAMLKLDRRGAPDKTTSPVGVTVDASSVTFAKTTIGRFTLDGTIACTTFDG